MKRVYLCNIIVYKLYFMQKIGLFLRFMQGFHVIIYSFLILCGLIVKIVYNEFSSLGEYRYIGTAKSRLKRLLAPLSGICG